jgi:replication factor C large subunit
VAEKENVSVDHAVMVRIAENANGDMRAALNDLQMVVEGKTSLSIGDSDALGKRNQLKELNGSLRMMFGSTSLKAARDSTMDVDLTPDELIMWIEEGIPRELNDHSDMADAFDALSRADIYLGRTRRYQHYSLWSYAKEMMTGGVALSRTSGTRPSINDYGFPSQLIVLSRARGPRAAHNSVSSKLSGYFHTSSKRLKESTIPFLQQMASKDRELVLRIAKEAGLDEGDVAYLLRVEPDSPEVDSIMRDLKGDESSPRKTGKRGSSRSGFSRF